MILTWLRKVNTIQPLKDIGIELNSVESPSRYIGGEYGSTIKPIADLMCLRYDHGALTFCTSNFNMESLEGGKYRPGYGKYVIDRMQQMMNFIVLPGGSRRKGVAL